VNDHGHANYHSFDRAAKAKQCEHVFLGNSERVTVCFKNQRNRQGRYVGGSVQKTVFSCLGLLCMQALASFRISSCTRGDVRLTAPQPACGDYGSKNIEMSHFFPPGNCNCFLVVCGRSVIK